MKTLIAALALTLAASAPALAFDPITDVGRGGDMQAYDIRDAGASAGGQVSGFTGVTGTKAFDPLTDVGRGGDMVSSLHHDANTFGFRIQPDIGNVIVLENDPVK